jgi:hypothetical protein
MSNEVMKPASNEVVDFNMDAWGSQFTASDVVFPRLLVAQSLSKFVEQEVCKVGDIVNTLTKEVLGGYTKPVKILPFYMTKQWVTLVKNGGGFKSITPDKGQVLPFEGELNGEVVNNYHQYTFFCMVEGSELPAMLSLKSTAHKTAKELAMFMYQIQAQARRCPAANWIELKTIKATGKTNGKSYAGITFSTDRDSTREELNSCLNWIKTINATNIVYEDDTEVGYDIPQNAESLKNIQTF